LLLKKEIRGEDNLETKTPKSTRATFLFGFNLGNKEVEKIPCSLFHSCSSGAVK
jgi:hypothetical protein